MNTDNPSVPTTLTRLAEAARHGFTFLGVARWREHLDRLCQVQTADGRQALTPESLRNCQALLLNLAAAEVEALAEHGLPPAEFVAGWPTNLRRSLWLCSRSPAYLEAELQAARQIMDAEDL